MTDSGSAICKKTGILGGTFNPVHNGHLQMAEYALKQYDLDEIWFLPNYIPPHKEAVDIDDLANDRASMLKLAINEHESYSICLIELERGGKSYTWETMEALTLKHPDREFYFIIGADSLFQFNSWVRPDRITQLCHILAAHRTYDGENTGFYDKIQELNNIYGECFMPLEMPYIDVSSTEIRKRARLGMDIGRFVPEDVSSYIKEHNIYRNIRKPVVENDYLDIFKELLIPPLKERRINHIKGTAETAVKLADIYGVDREKAYIAGMMHDLCKSMPQDELISYCEYNCIPISETEYNCPFLLHGAAASYMASYAFGITDTDIQNAIKWHTTGRPGMSDLEKIIFTADYIEPGRGNEDHFLKGREAVLQDLDYGVYIITGLMLDYLQNNGSVIDSKTVDTHVYYENKILHS